MSFRTELESRLKKEIIHRLEMSSDYERSWLDPNAYEPAVRFDSSIASEEESVFRLINQIYSYQVMDLEAEGVEKFVDFFCKNIESSMMAAINETSREKHISCVELGFDLDLRYRVSIVKFRYSMMEW